MHRILSRSTPCRTYTRAVLTSPTVVPVHVKSTTGKSASSTSHHRGSTSHFSWVRANPTHGKPRTKGLTEIRGPYYTPMGPRYLQDLVEGMGHAIDGLKFAGGSFSVLDKKALESLLKIARDNGVYTSTGGWIEHVLTQGPESTIRYINECAEVGFDMVEVSAGFITLPLDDLLRVIKEVKKAGLKAKAEIGVQFGAGGASGSAALTAEGTLDPGWAVEKALRCLDAGADMIMMESEGITEDVKEGAWRTDVPAIFVNKVGLDKVMFEAADPKVFEWYIKNYGPDVNLFVDHSQIVQLECLRRGIWGTTSLWGRVVSFEPPQST